MYSVRYFFCVPGKEGDFEPNADLIGKVRLDDMSDGVLREKVDSLICSNDEFLLKTKTHTVVADVGVAKEVGGLGASHPHETVILYRPPTREG